MKVGIIRCLGAETKIITGPTEPVLVKQRRSDAVVGF